jgi:nitrogen fixation protein NifQ
MNPLAIVVESSRDAVRNEWYSRLCGCSTGEANAEWLARMLASKAVDEGAMPGRLGLGIRQYGAMMARYFPVFDHAVFHVGRAIEPGRAAEREELRMLFLSHAADGAIERVWMADILAAGCMAEDHLWQDLGLWSRKDVSGLIEHNFPRLKAKNDRDMKWKKFFYKQLCVQEGIYTCRSPSCEVCNDYRSCFGVEE